jgi:hypothetical protein
MLLSVWVTLASTLPSVWVTLASMLSSVWVTLAGMRVTLSSMQRAKPLVAFTTWPAGPSVQQMLL